MTTQESIDDMNIIQHWLPVLESKMRIGLEQDYAKDIRDLLITNNPLVNQYIDWFDKFEGYT